MFDVAVIIPTYNRARLIAAALDSVLAQSYPGRIEAAVVDDGSSDDTAAVMQPYLAQYRNEAGKVVIRYTRLEKQGVVTARNTAIAQTTAPLVAFLDSDDYWHADKLRLQIEVLNADAQIGLVHTGFRYVNEAGEMADDGPQRVDNPCHGDRGKCVNVLMDEDLVIFSSVLARRSVIAQAAAAEPHGLPFDPRWTNAQDYDLLLRCARLCAFVYLSAPLTYYRLHGGHGAMGNFKRAFGFHGRVQLDFAKRWGKDVGIDEADAHRRVAAFLYSRAHSHFWQRRLDVCRQLCDLAEELGVSDERFAELYRKASRPAWMYRVKDRVDRLLGRNLEVRNS
ncbi:MAG: glycosyltransferase [Phycisphaeraceae bacterium]